MKNAKILGLFVVLGLILRLSLSRVIYSGDLNNHIGWGRTITVMGGSGAYDREYSGIMQPTYPPLALYAFTSSYWAYKNIYEASRHLNSSFSMFPSKIIWWLEDQNTLPAFQKIIGIFSDLGIGVLIYLLAISIGVSKNKSLLASGAFIFNPATWYNSALWGQIESFPLFWLLLAIWFLHKNKWQLSHLSFMASLLSKQSTVIFIPFFFLFSLKKIGWKNTLLGGLLQLMLMYFAYLPFFKTTDIMWPFKVYINRIQVGSGSNFITDHAFNVWVFYSHLQKIADNNVAWLGILGFISGTLMYLPKLFKTLSLKNILSTMGMTALLAFWILTRMHERYLAPALPFLAILSVTSPVYIFLYIVVSFGNLVNMYHNWWVPTIPSWVAWTSLWSTINGVAISLGIVWLIWLIKYYYDKE